FSPDGRRLLTAGDRTARLWDVVPDSTTERKRGRWPGTRWAVPSPDGRRLATSSPTAPNSGDVHLWDTRTGAELARLPGLEGDTGSSVQFSADGFRLLTVSQPGGTVRLWDVLTGQVLGTLPDRFANALLCPDGRRVLTL